MAGERLRHRGNDRIKVTPLRLADILRPFDHQAHDRNGGGEHARERQEQQLAPALRD